MAGPDFLHWQKLLDFFSLKVMKLFIVWFALAPIALKMLQSVPDKVLLSGTENPIYLHLSLPFSWIILWLSSFFFALAYMLYIIRCPGFIRAYHDFSSYKSALHSSRYIVWHLEASYNKSGGNDKLVKRLIEKNLVSKIPLENYRQGRKEAGQP